LKCSEGALGSGRREAFQTVLGNSTGIFGWALASVLGISALVAASEAAFAVLKVAGAVVLVWLGVQALRGTAAGEEPARLVRSPYARGGASFSTFDPFPV
jgi:threonine/homoserine/homoserine lactone efflux protein